MRWQLALIPVICCLGCGGSSPCDDAVCVAGTTCSPADGLCHETGGSVSADGGDPMGSAASTGPSQPDAGSIAPPPPSGSFELSHGRSPQFAIDAAGTQHMATLDNDANGTVTYLECAADCGVSSQWSRVAFSATAGSAASLSLSMVGTGRPRLSWTQQVQSGGGAQQALFIAGCDSACAQPSSWTVSTTITLPPAWDDFRFVALPNAGLVWTYSVGANTGPNPGTYLDLCQADCVNGQSWSEVQLPVSWALSFLSLASSADGRLGFLLGDVDGAVYAECDSNCSSASSWQTTNSELAGVKSGSVAFASTGEVRLGASTYAGQLLYGACSSNCASSSSWSMLTLSVGSVSWDVATLSLDANDRPLIAGTDDDDVYGLSCSSDCESGQGTWSEWVALENSKLPPPPPPSMDLSFYWNWSTLTVASDAHGGVVISAEADYVMSVFDASSNYYDFSTQDEQTWFSWNASP